MRCRRRPRRRPREPERVPGARWYRTHCPITPRRTPPMKTRRKMKMLPLQPGETRKGRPHNRGGRRVQEGKDSPSGLLHHRRRRRRRVAAQGQAPGEVISIRILEQVIVFLCRTAFPNAEHDYAGRHEPVSMYRRTAPWACRTWIAIQSRPPPPLILLTTPRCCLKRHRVDGRQSWRHLKATFRTPGAEGTGPLRAPSSALSRTPRRNLQWFQTRAGGLLTRGARRLCR